MDFEAVIKALTQPVNGQYPRPWMTKLTDPETAKVFIVGKNQAKTFRVSDVGTHENYLDALFNRGDRSCRDLYNQLAGAASPTRNNIDNLTVMLEQHGCPQIIETNVICYSTGMSGQLHLPEHRDGVARGREIFSFLLGKIRPRVLIVHGDGAGKELSRSVGITILQPASVPGPPPAVTHHAYSNKDLVSIISIRSLALPEWNKWKTWAPAHLQKVVRLTASLCSE